METALRRAGVTFHPREGEFAAKRFCRGCGPTGNGNVPFVAVPLKGLEFSSIRRACPLAFVQHTGRYRLPPVVAVLVVVCLLSQAFSSLWVSYVETNLLLPFSLLAFASVAAAVAALACRGAATAVRDSTRTMGEMAEATADGVRPPGVAERPPPLRLFQQPSGKIVSAVDATSWGSYQRPCWCCMVPLFLMLQRRTEQVVAVNGLRRRKQ